VPESSVESSPKAELIHVGLQRSEAAVGSESGVGELDPQRTLATGARVHYDPLHHLGDLRDDAFGLRKRSDINPEASL
jgi:hypothetical protein